MPALSTDCQLRSCTSCHVRAAEPSWAQSAAAETPTVTTADITIPAVNQDKDNMATSNRRITQ